MATDAVITQDKDGAEFEFESAAIAKKARPDARVVRFARTQEPFKEGTKASAPANPPAVVAMGGDLVTSAPEETAPAATTASAPKEKA